MVKLCKTNIFDDKSFFISCNDIKKKYLNYIYNEFWK